MIHFWNLPEERTYIILNEKFKQKVIVSMREKNVPAKIFLSFKKTKVKVSLIKVVSKTLDCKLDLFEKNILWIGGLNSRGLSNPKLPIILSGRILARFVAAIVNDGCLTKEGNNNYGRLFYDNFDQSLRSSIISDYLMVFGGNSNEIVFRDYKTKKYLEFPSIIRDIIFLILKHKGSKADNNIKLPQFVFENKENMIGWIEQTIADEGEVKYYPDKYRRAIIWRRSFDITDLFSEKIINPIPFSKLSKNIKERFLKCNFNLFKSELKILNKLGLQYKVYNLGVYSTKKKKIRVRLQISLTQRKNLLKLRELIKIPSQIKEDKFTQLCLGFQRYKEPLIIKEAIIDLCKKKGIVNSRLLKFKMNYKKINTSIYWLNKFERAGLIKKVRFSEYGYGEYRKPAEYILKKPR